MVPDISSVKLLYAIFFHISYILNVISVVTYSILSALNIYELHLEEVQLNNIFCGTLSSVPHHSHQSNHNLFHIHYYKR